MHTPSNLRNARLHQKHNKVETKSKERSCPDITWIMKHCYMLHKHLMGQLKAKATTPNHNNPQTVPISSTSD